MKRSILSDVLTEIRSSRFDKNSLSRRADQVGVSRAALEKDYVISLVLLLISDLPEFSPYSREMVFRGGTCLKKAFFPDEMRFSEDLDFTNLTLEDSDSFLKHAIDLAKKNFGVTTFERCEVLYRNEKGLDFILYYTSLLQQRNHISFNISTSKPIEETIPMKIDTSSYFHRTPIISTMSLSEITSEKMRALLQRKKPRDVFDIWFLINKRKE